jgi:hypothetical protein
MGDHVQVNRVRVINWGIQVQSIYAWNPSAFVLDREGALFHTISPRAPSLVEENGRLVNPKTGQSPCFVHAPYRGDLSKVEQWLTQYGNGRAIG